MIHTTKAFTATCDNCNVDFEDSDSGYSGFSDKEGLWESMERNKWHKEGRKHYCPDCLDFKKQSEKLKNIPPSK